MERIDLKKKIMRRVYAIFILRKIFNPVMYRLYLLILLLGGVASFVSVSNVFANMPSGSLSEIYDFILYAFAHTELIVQALTLGLVAASLWFLATLMRNIARAPRLASVS